MAISMRLRRGQRTELADAGCGNDTLRRTDMVNCEWGVERYSLTGMFMKKLLA